jgi:hypothetical protein
VSDDKAPRGRHLHSVEGYLGTGLTSKVARGDTVILAENDDNIRKMTV